MPVPVAFAASGAQGDIADAITIEDAVFSGLSNNPSYNVVKASRGASAQALLQAHALYLPSIDFRGDTGFEYTDNLATGGSGEKLGRYDASLTLTQLLFDGFETQYENRRQKALLKSASLRMQESGEFTGLSMVEAYLELARQRKLLAIARQNLRQHHTIFERIEDSTNAGRSTLADLNQIKTRVAAARSQELSAIQALRVAEAGYYRQFGVMAGGVFQPPELTNVLHENVEREVDAALKQSPTLSSLKADIDAAYAEQRQTRASFYPKIDVQINAREGRDLGGVRGRDTSASALAVMDWNLYRGGGDSARVEEFEYRKDQAIHQRDSTKRDMANNVRQTWFGMEAANARKQEFAIQVDANEKLVVAYKDQFELGRRTLLDVLDTQNAFFSARSNNINEEFIELLAVYRLLALRGDLLKTLGIGFADEEGTLTKFSQVDETLDKSVSPPEREDKKDEDDRTPKRERR